MVLSTKFPLFFFSLVNVKCIHWMVLKWHCVSNAASAVYNGNWFCLSDVDIAIGFHLMSTEQCMWTIICIFKPIQFIRTFFRYFVYERTKRKTLFVVAKRLKPHPHNFMSELAGPFQCSLSISIWFALLISIFRHFSLHYRTGTSKRLEYFCLIHSIQFNKWDAEDRSSDKEKKFAIYISWAPYTYTSTHNAYYYYYYL